MPTPEEFRTVLHGPVVAMTTPFNKKDLSLDLSGTRTLIDHYCENKSGPIIVGGSTGEFHALTMDERKVLLETAIDQADGRLPIIAGCPHSGTHLALDLVKHAQKEGAVGVMVTPPYYNYSGFEGVYRHFEIISGESDIGIMIYFSGALRAMVQEIFAPNPSLLYKICDLPHVVSVKDSSGNFMFLKAISQALKGKKAVVASYGLDYFLWGYDYGCPSWITSLGKVWPQVEHTFWRALQSGDRETALRIAREQDRPSRDYANLRPKRYSYFPLIKALLDLEGLPGGPSRPPLLDWPEEDLPRLREDFTRLGLLKGK